ncbi:gliding motility-associated C-terminal domain-containing protein [Pedobacter sp. GR22-6]|uniref:gliding motility-associated C-terminal domain-containing protein n=1 Tax=Pedobacter sp. GR22-6 TaxID=3127957 RepID=UPI00307D3ADC
MNKKLRLLVTFLGLLFICFSAKPASIADPVPRPVTICSGASIIIKGDQPTALTSTYLWELYYSGSWHPASGTYTEQDYLAASLLNMGESDVVFTLRRKTTVLGVSVYDSYYLVTVQPIVAIQNNSINEPVNSNFCGSGNPGTITGSVALAGNAVILYQWRVSSDGISFSNILGANSKDYAPGPQQESVYLQRVAMTGGCGLATFSNIIQLTVYPVLSNNSISGALLSQICKDTDPSVISGSLPSGGNGGYAYTWQHSTDGVNFSDIPGATAKDYDPPVLLVSTHFRRLSKSGSCDVSLSNVVGFEVLPKLAAVVVRAESIGRDGITFSWDAVPGARGYMVSTDAGRTYSAPSSGANGLSHSISGLKAAAEVRILVKAMGQLSCQEQDEIKDFVSMTLKEFDGIYVPNAFSPNQDGKNDIIYVRGETIRALRFYIYNQWGEQIFYSADPALGWDGTYKGKMVPVGGYVYYLKAVMNNGEELKRKGTITLIR